LAASTYLQACQLSQNACGKSLSKQAFGILPKIRDVDEQMRLLADSQCQVREVHPEVCFYFWMNGRPMQFGKKDREGFNERLRLVESTFPGAFRDVRGEFARGAVADDDVVDALAALWTAERVASGAARTVPDRPPLDRYGLRMEMVA
jgi:predicted RNase H-like nuclease